MSFGEDLLLHLRASVPALYVESHEWQRFREDANQCCKTLEKSLFIWNSMRGLSKVEAGGLSPVEEEILDPRAILEFLCDQERVQENSVYVLEFFDHHLDTAHSPQVAPDLAVALRPLRERNAHVVILSPVLRIPEAVRNEFAVLEFPLPDREAIGDILELVREDYNEKAGEQLEVMQDPRILDSVRGLGTTEIWNAFAKAAAQYERITTEEIPTLVAEKEQSIRKSGYLEFVRTGTQMDSDVGGLDKLKEWLEGRKEAFGPKARAAKVNAPKGVLLVGVPGTGKSLCAKAVASQWEMPLLRLDMGSVFGGLVGESESNIRNAIKVAEGLAPCVLWIDEIEKGFSGGATGGGELDGGTSTRVFGTFLTWMQEKDKEVFVFATANNLSRMPPELLRKGRFDEVFFVDLPGDEARRAIFCIHLERRAQELVARDLRSGSEQWGELVKKTAGFSGSEIEEVVSEALLRAYNKSIGQEQDIVVDIRDMIKIAEGTVPLATTMRETIEGLRKSKARFRPTSSDEPPQIPTNASPPLISEGVSPFTKGGRGAEG